MSQIIQAEINAKFNPESWYASRFSDGTWPVFYAAEHEDTALKEILYHLHQFYREELAIKSSIAIDRRVVKLDLTTEHCGDLTKRRDLALTQLTSQDDSGYPYCQQLAKSYLDCGAEALRTPSARHPDGICVPVFSKRPLNKDHGHLRYLKLILTKDGASVFSEEMKSS